PLQSWRRLATYLRRCLSGTMLSMRGWKSGTQRRRRSDGARAESFRGEPAQDVQTIWRCIGRQEIRDGGGCPSGSLKEFHGPFRDPLLRDVNVTTRFGLVNMLALQNQRKRLFGPLNLARASQSLVIGDKRVEVVIPLVFIRRTVLGMTPDPIFQN